jgi:hypothetical protein
MRGTLRAGRPALAAAELQGRTNVNQACPAGAFGSGDRMADCTFRERKGKQP